MLPHTVLLFRHPALRLATCIVLLLAIQLAWGPWLVLLVVPLALWGGAAADFRRLLRRTRWLLLSLFAVFALGTPGSVWWSPLGMWVTREGMGLALEHSARLVAVLAVVAGLLASTAPQALAAGLLTLLSPLGRLGLPVNRAVARLVLVLQAIDSVPRRAGQSELAGTWRFSLASLVGMLPSDGAGEAGRAEVLVIPQRPMAVGERWGLAVLGLVAMVLAISLIGEAA
ncbi:CbiQ family ECF transporter T component [Oryzomicrobium terrae]|uniref:CbiQ family ECF transporter T component n=1 Tax=Oryzomicrobium terrae TaxID=1735038 RepID=UPI001659ACFB|nr:CbiQ family ECF transporter T component [Oryzomicrobium terrae]